MRRITRCLLGTFLLTGGVLLTPPASHAQQVVNLPAEDTPIEVQRSDVFKVGALDGADWEVFGSVDGVAFDAAGNLFVLDGQNQRVLVFDEAGELLRTIGRAGGGPGEFRMPRGMTVGGKGTVVVFDFMRRAFQLFDEKGNYTESIRTDPMQDGGMPSSVMMAHPEGGFVLQFDAFNIDTGDPATSQENGATIPLRWFPLAGDTGFEELAKVPRIGPPPTMTMRPGEVSMNMPPGIALSPQMSWGTLPDGGIAYWTGPEYEIHVQSNAGSRVLRRPLSARPVTSRDRADVRARMKANFDAGGGPVMIVSDGSTTRRDDGARDRAFENQMETLQFADVVPVIERIGTDHEGRIWVQRTGRRISEEGPVDLLGPNGEYLGTMSGVEVPNAFGPDGSVAVVEVDEFGVQSVRVMRWQLSDE